MQRNILRYRQIAKHPAIFWGKSQAYLGNVQVGSGNVPTLEDNGTGLGYMIPHNGSQRGGLPCPIAAISSSCRSATVNILKNMAGLDGYVEALKCQH